MIRLAARDPDQLAGRLDVLSSFFRATKPLFIGEEQRVHFITRRLIPEYLGRLPPGAECKAIKALFEYESNGVAQSLTTRYHNASSYLPSKTGQFARRTEPRLLLACAKQFLNFDRDDALDDLLLASKQAGDLPQDIDLLSPIAAIVWTRTVEEHQDRLTAIGEGSVPLRDQDEMLELLVEITNAAESTLHSVDQTASERWFNEPRLARYLQAQLARARSGEVEVTRLRAVRQVDLEDVLQRSLLREFVRRHDDAGANLLLCHETDLRGMNTSFLRSTASSGQLDRTIMVIADGERRPAGLVSALDEEGYVKESTLFLKSSAQVRRHLRDLKRIVDHVRTRGEDVSEMLAAFDDPPLSELRLPKSLGPHWPIGPPAL